jgi:SAM-dependent methyltransferase
MSAVPPDYDADPERSRSWRAASDVHDVVGPELRGPVLDVGCGDGRLAALLVGRGVAWVGVDSSPSQLAANPYRPVVLADMRCLPFRDAVFREVTHLWCLYHLDEPVLAISEARRVLQDGGPYFASTSARDNDPELMPEGYPRSTFDAEDAAELVGVVFPHVEADRWDGPFVVLRSREELVGYCRSHFIPLERAEGVEVPLRLTKRGVLVRATKA